jgi:hypothetical protein
MTTNMRVLRRFAYTFSAMMLLVSVGIPLLHYGSAAAATQLGSRSITMSDSGASGNSTITSGVGSGTNVTYQVSFTTSTTASSLVIDFCANDPIIGDTCVPPTGMNASGAALTGVTGNIGTGWNITPSGNQVKLAAGGGGSAASPGSQVFDLTGITNPSTLTNSTSNTSATFYARIYTYFNNTYGSYTGSSPTSNVGNFEDYGGIAMSVTQTISITARVQESLEFCVSGDNTTTWTTTGDCSDTNAAAPPVLILGHGTPTAVLDSTAVDTGTVYSQLSTNATHGAVIDMRNSNTTCGGLSADGGATCAIPAVGATAAAITAGTAKFGMYEAPSSDQPVVGSSTAGTGAFTLNPTYDDGSHQTAPNLYYGMDTTAGTGVDSTFGSQIASTATPCYRVDDAYTYGATASLTTPAGIYTANMNMIATGTF